MLAQSRIFLLFPAGPPVALNKTLAFCAYARGSSSCCDAAADATLQKQFDAFNVSDASCAALLKPILCAVPSSFPCFLLSSPHAHRGPRHTPVRRFASLEWITCSRFGFPCLFLFSYYTSTVLFIHVKKKKNRDTDNPPLVQLHLQFN